MTLSAECRIIRMTHPFVREAELRAQYIVALGLVLLVTIAVYLQVAPARAFKDSARVVLDDAEALARQIDEGISYDDYLRQANVLEIDLNALERNFPHMKKDAKTYPKQSEFFVQARKALDSHTRVLENWNGNLYTATPESEARRRDLIEFHLTAASKRTKLMRQVYDKL